MLAARTATMRAKTSAQRQQQLKESKESYTTMYKAFCAQVGLRLLSWVSFLADEVRLRLLRRWRIYARPCAPIYC